MALTSRTVYMRLLAFAKPYSSFLPQYILTFTLAVFLGTFNFTMLIPLFDVLFTPTDPSKLQLPPYPELSFSVKYFKQLFEYYFNDALITYGKQGTLFIVSIFIVTSVFLANVFRYIAGKIVNRVRSKIIGTLRTTLFEKFMHLPLSYFSGQKKGELMARLTTDVQEIEHSMVDSLKALFKGPITILVYFAVLFSLSIKLTVFTILYLPISAILIGQISKKLKKKGKISQLLLGEILVQIEEAFSAVKIIQGFTAHTYIFEKFAKVNRAYVRNTESLHNKHELSGPSAEFIGVVAVTGIILYGGSLVLQENSELSPSSFIAYIILYSQILPPAKIISTAMAAMQRGLASGERVLAILDQEITIKDIPDAISKKSFDSSITFENVSFAYQEECILDSLSFEIKKGEVVALVGPSGGGKSTIADLIPRFHDVNGGRICIDGKDIREIKLKDLRELMGIVTQEAVLFNDSIKNNIVFGMESISQESIEHAAKIAHAHGFILDTEEGYDTTIGDKGSRLSGGQRQRISIARAVLKNPEILILDEATSALDSESEKQVQLALNEVLKGRTALVIAHRLSTIRNADKILVIEKGKIVESGPHDVLIQNKEGIYARWIQMQQAV